MQTGETAFSGDTPHASLRQSTAASNNVIARASSQKESLRESKDNDLKGIGKSFKLSFKGSILPASLNLRRKKLGQEECEGDSNSEDGQVNQSKQPASDGRERYPTALSAGGSMEDEYYIQGKVDSFLQQRGKSFLKKGKEFLNSNMNAIPIAMNANRSQMEKVLTAIDGVKEQMDEQKERLAIIETLLKAKSPYVSKESPRHSTDRYLNTDANLQAITENVLSGVQSALDFQRKRLLQNGLNLTLFGVFIGAWLLNVSMSKLDDTSRLFICFASLALSYLIGNHLICKSFEQRVGVSIPVKGTREKPAASFASVEEGNCPKFSGQANDRLCRMGRSRASFSECKSKSLNLSRRTTAEVDSTISQSDFERSMSFNFLEGSGVDFLKHLNSRTDKEQNIFSIYKTHVFDALSHTADIDRSRPYEIPDDFNLLRFLEADEYELRPAIKRIIDTVAWRQQYGIRELAVKPPETLELYRSLRRRTFLGRDKLQRPVIYENIADFFDNSLVPSALSREEWSRCYAYETADLFREFREASMDTNTVIHKATTIINLKKVKLSHIKKLGLITNLKNDVEVHYPETVGVIHLVNAPSFLPRLWSVVQKILDPNVTAKIRIHQDEGTDALLEEIDEDVLPVCLGGKSDVAL